MPIALKQPKFRGCCVFVGVVQCVLALSVLVRGVEVLAPFGVPESTLVSPHFGDAIYWVYTHMVVLGALIIAIGLRVTDPAARTTLSRLLFVAHAYYTQLDLRTSDSALANGLYQGDATLVLVLLAACFTAIFAYLSISKTATGR